MSPTVECQELPANARFSKTLFADLPEPSGAAGKTVSDLYESAITHWENLGSRHFENATRDEVEIAPVRLRVVREIKVRYVPAGRIEPIPYEFDE